MRWRTAGTRSTCSSVMRGVRDRLVSLPAAGAVEVPGVAALEALLHLSGERVVSPLQVRELRLPTGFGRLDREEHRRARRNRLVGLVGVPERGPVADRIVLLPLAAVVADGHHLGIARHAKVVEHVRNGLAPPAAEREVLVLGHVLVADDEQPMLVHRVGEGPEHLVVETSGDVDPDRLDPEARTLELTNRKHVRSSRYLASAGLPVSSPASPGSLSGARSRGQVPPGSACLGPHSSPLPAAGFSL